MVSQYFELLVPLGVLLETTSATSQREKKLIHVATVEQKSNQSLTGTNIMVHQIH